MYVAHTYRSVVSSRRNIGGRRERVAPLCGEELRAVSNQVDIVRPHLIKNTDQVANEQVMGHSFIFVQGVVVLTDRISQRNGARRLNFNCR